MNVEAWSKRGGVLLALLALAMVARPAGGEDGEDGSDAERFVGNWDLVSFESVDAHGEVTERRMIGRLMYDSTGHMAAQLVPTERSAPPAEASREERWAAERGFVGYFGAYEVDPVGKRVIHRVAGSVFQSWLGRELVRHYELEDGLLKLSLKQGDRVTGTLTWRRLD